MGGDEEGDPEIEIPVAEEFVQSATETATDLLVASFVAQLGMGGSEEDDPEDEILIDEDMEEQARQMMAEMMGTVTSSLAAQLGMGSDFEDEYEETDEVETDDDRNSRVVDPVPDSSAQTGRQTGVVVTNEADKDAQVPDDELFVISTIPTPIPAALSVPSPVAAPIVSTPVHVPAGFVLGLSPNKSDSDDDEDIVFNPPPLSLSTAPQPTRVAISSAPTAMAMSVKALMTPSAIVTPTSLRPPVPVVSTPTPSHNTFTNPPFIPVPDGAPPKAAKLKLTKSQKRALNREGKKARKAGKTHSRSGNLHLAGDASSDEDQAEGEEMFSAMGGQIEDVRMDEEMGSPRMGDSDLDWGENGPGGQGDAKKAPGKGKNRKERRKAERADAREVERMERLSVGARGEVAIALGVKVDKLVVRIQEDIEVEVKGRRDLSALDAAAQDYAMNVAEGSEEDDLSFLLRASLTGQKTIAELDDEERARDDEAAEHAGDQSGWRTTDESDSGNDDTSDEEADSDDELEMDILLGEADAQYVQTFLLSSLLLTKLPAQSRPCTRCRGGRSHRRRRLPLLRQFIGRGRRRAASSRRRQNHPPLLDGRRWTRRETRYGGEEEEKEGEGQDGRRCLEHGRG